MNNLFERLNLSDALRLTSELILTEFDNLDNDQCQLEITQCVSSLLTVNAFQQSLRI